MESIGGWTRIVRDLGAWPALSGAALAGRVQLRGRAKKRLQRRLVNLLALLEVEPNKTLSYTWGAMGLESVVTWTLTASGTGTRLRMEQAGFRADQQQAYQGAKFGWSKFLASLEQVLARTD